MLYSISNIVTSNERASRNPHVARRNTSLKNIATNQTLGDASQRSYEQNVAYTILCGHLHLQDRKLFFFRIANLANLARVAFCVASALVGWFW